MKKSLLVLAVLLYMPSLGLAKPKEVHVLKITETGDILIDTAAKPKTKFDIFKTEQITDSDDPNNVITIEIPVARIVITHKASGYSVGTIINRIDGSKPESSDISTGMLCSRTTKATLKAEKKIYKNQKKASKRQYKLTKIKAKTGVYESLDTTVADTNEITTLKAGLIRVEKNAKDGNDVTQK